MEDLLASLQGEVDVLAQIEANVSIDEVVLLMDLVGSLKSVIVTNINKLILDYKDVLTSTLPHIFELFLNTNYDPSNTYECVKDLIDIVTRIVPFLNNINSLGLFTSVNEFMEGLPNFLIIKVPEERRDEIKDYFSKNLLNSCIIGKITESLSEFSEQIYSDWDDILPKWLQLISNFIMFKDIEWYEDKDINLNSLTSFAEKLDISIQFVTCTELSSINAEINKIYGYFNKLTTNINIWEIETYISCSNHVIFCSLMIQFISNLTCSQYRNYLTKCISIRLTSMLCTHLQELLNSDSKNTKEKEYIPSLLSRSGKTIKDIFIEMIDQNISREFNGDFNRIFLFILKNYESNSIIDKFIGDLIIQDETKDEKYERIEITDIIFPISDLEIGEKERDEYMIKNRKCGCLMGNIQNMNTEQITCLFESLCNFKEVNMVILRLIIRIRNDIYRNLASAKEMYIKTVKTAQINQMFFHGKQHGENILYNDNLRRNSSILKKFFCFLLLLACGLKWKGSIKDIPVDEREIDKERIIIQTNMFDEIKLDIKLKNYLRNELIGQIEVILDFMDEIVINTILNVIQLCKKVKFCYNFIKLFRDRRFQRTFAEMDLLDKFGKINDLIIPGIYKMIEANIRKYNGKSFDDKVFEIYYNMFKDFFNYGVVLDKNCLDIDSKIVRICFEDNSLNYKKLNMLVDRMMNGSERYHFFKRMKGLFIIETQKLFKEGRQVYLNKNNTRLLLALCRYVLTPDEISQYKSEENIIYDIQNLNDLMTRKQNKLKETGENLLFTDIPSYFDDSDTVSDFMYNMLDIFIPIGFVFFSIRKISQGTSTLKKIIKYRREYYLNIMNTLYLRSKNNKLMKNLTCLMKYIMNITFSTWLKIKNTYNSSKIFDEYRESSLNQVSFGLELLSNLLVMVAPIYCYNSFYCIPNMIDTKIGKINIQMVPQNQIYRGENVVKIVSDKTELNVSGCPIDNFGNRCVVAFSKQNPYNTSEKGKALYDAFISNSFIPISSKGLYNPFVSFADYLNIFADYQRINNPGDRLSITQWIIDLKNMDLRNDFFNIINNVLNGDEIKCFNLSMFKLMSLLYEEDFSDGLEPETCLTFLKTSEVFFLSLPPSYIFYAKVYNKINNFTENEENMDPLATSRSFEEFIKTKYKMSDNFFKRRNYQSFILSRNDEKNEIIEIMKIRSYVLELSLYLILCRTDDGKISNRQIIPFLFVIQERLRNINHRIEEHILKSEQQSPVKKPIERKNRELLMKFKTSFIETLTNVIYNLILKISYIRRGVHLRSNTDITIDNNKKINQLRYLYKDLSLNTQNFLTGFSLGCYIEEKQSFSLNHGMFKLIFRSMFMNIMDSLAFDSELEKFVNERNPEGYLLSKNEYIYPMIIIHDAIQILRQLDTMKSNNDGNNSIMNSSKIVQLINENMIYGSLELDEFITNWKNHTIKTKLCTFIKYYSIILQYVNAVENKHNQNIELIRLTRLKSIIGILTDYYFEIPTNDLNMTFNDHKVFIDCIMCLLNENFYDFSELFKLESTRRSYSNENVEGGNNDSTFFYPMKGYISIFNYFGNIVSKIIEYLKGDLDESFNDSLFGKSSNIDPSDFVESIKYSLKLVNNLLQDKDMDNYTDSAKYHILSYYYRVIEFKEFMTDYIIDPIFRDVKDYDAMNLKPNNETQLHNDSLGSNSIDSPSEYMDISPGDLNRNKNILLVKYLSSSSTEILKYITDLVKIFSTFQGYNNYENEIKSNVGEEYKEYIYRCFLKEALCFNKYYLIDRPTSVTGLEGIKDKNMRDKNGSRNEETNGYCNLWDQIDEVNFSSMKSPFCSDCINQSNGKYPGLTNVGQTCYINCIIQQLFFNTGFKLTIDQAYRICSKIQDSTLKSNNSILIGEGINGIGMNLSEEHFEEPVPKFVDDGENANKQLSRENVRLVLLIGQLFKDMGDLGSKIIDMHDICTKLAQMEISDKIGLQSDAMEFFCNFVERLFDELNLIPDVKDTINTFSFKKVEKFMLSCGHSRQNIEDLIYVQISLILYTEKKKIEDGIPIKEVLRIQDIISRMASSFTENSDEIRNYECYSNGCKGDYLDEMNKPKSRLISTEEKIFNTPRDLILFIPRLQQDFNYDWFNWIDLRIDKVINIEPLIDKSLSNDKSDRHTYYILSGIVLHLGSDEFGHYISYCRERQEEELKLETDEDIKVELSHLKEIVENSQWYEMNDGSILAKRRKDFFKPLNSNYYEENLGRSNDLVDTDTYIGFYEKESPYILFYNKIFAEVVDTKESDPEKSVIQRNSNMEKPNNDEDMKSEESDDVERANNEFKTAITYSRLYSSLLENDITFISSDNIENLMIQSVNDCIKYSIDGSNDNFQCDKLLKTILKGLLAVTDDLKHTCDFRLIKKYISVSLHNTYQIHEPKELILSKDTAYRCISNFADVLTFILYKMAPENNYGAMKCMENQEIVNIIGMLLVCVALVIECWSDYFPYISELLLLKIGVYRNILISDFKEDYLQKDRNMKYSRYSCIVQQWILTPNKFYNNVIGTMLYILLSRPREILLETLTEIDPLISNKKAIDEDKKTKILNISATITKMNEVLIDLLLPVNINRYYNNLDNSNVLNNLVITFSTFDTDILSYNSWYFSKYSNSANCGKEDLLDFGHYTPQNIVPITPIFYYLGRVVSYFHDILTTLCLESYFTNSMSYDEMKLSFFKKLTWKNVIACNCMNYTLHTGLNDELMEKDYFDENNHITDQRLIPYVIKFPRTQYIINDIESIIALALTSIFYGYPKSYPDDNYFNFGNSMRRVRNFEFIGKNIVKIMKNNENFLNHNSYMSEMLMTISYFANCFTRFCLKTEDDEDYPKYIFSYYTPANVNHLSSMVKNINRSSRKNLLARGIKKRSIFAFGIDYLKMLYRTGIRYLFKKYNLYDQGPNDSSFEQERSAYVYTFPNISLGYCLAKIDYWIWSKNKISYIIEYKKSRITNTYLSKPPCVDITDNNSSIYIESAVWETISDIIDKTISTFGPTYSSIFYDSSKNNFSRFFAHNVSASRLFEYTIELLHSQVPNKYLFNVEKLDKKINDLFNLLRNVTIPSHIRHTLLEILRIFLDRKYKFTNQGESVTNSNDSSTCLLRPLKCYSEIRNSVNVVDDFVREMFPPLDFRSFREDFPSSLCLEHYNKAISENIKYCRIIYACSSNNIGDSLSEQKTLQQYLMKDMMLLLHDGIIKEYHKEVNLFNDAFCFNENTLDQFKKLVDDNDLSKVFSVTLYCDGMNEDISKCRSLLDRKFYIESIFAQSIFCIMNQNLSRSGRIDINAIISLVDFQYLFDIHYWLMRNVVVPLESKVKESITLKENYNCNYPNLEKTGDEFVCKIFNLLNGLERDFILKQKITYSELRYKGTNLKRKMIFALFLELILIMQLLSIIQKVLDVIKVYHASKICKNFEISFIISKILDLSLECYKIFEDITRYRSVINIVKTLNKDCQGECKIMFNEQIFYIILNNIVLDSISIFSSKSSKYLICNINRKKHNYIQNREIELSQNTLNIICSYMKTFIKSDEGYAFDIVRSLLHESIDFGTGKGPMILDSKEMEKDNIAKALKRRLFESFTMLLGLSNIVNSIYLDVIEDSRTVHLLILAFIVSVLENNNLLKDRQEQSNLMKALLSVSNNLARMSENNLHYCLVGELTGLENGRTYILKLIYSLISVHSLIQRYILQRRWTKSNGKIIFDNYLNAAEKSMEKICEIIIKEIEREKQTYYIHERVVCKILLSDLFNEGEKMEKYQYDKSNFVNAISVILVNLCEENDLVKSVKKMEICSPEIAARIKQCVKKMREDEDIFKEQELGQKDRYFFESEEQPNADMMENTNKNTTDQREENKGNDSQSNVMRLKCDNDTNSSEVSKLLSEGDHKDLRTDDHEMAEMDDTKDTSCPDEIIREYDCASTNKEKLYEEKQDKTETSESFTHTSLDGDSFIDEFEFL